MEAKMEALQNGPNGHIPPTPAIAKTEKSYVHFLGLDDNMPKAVHKALQAKAAALEGPEWDSGSDGGEDEDDLMAMSEIKTASKRKHKIPVKTNSTVRKADLARRGGGAGGVIYIGHLPAELGENELRAFLSQFGNVDDLRVSKSLKTGRPRGYAFVKFDDAEVASIVAETMAGYFVGKRRLVCNLVPVDKQTKSLFFDTESQILKKKGRRLAQVLGETKSLSKPKKMARITSRLIKREEKKREQMKLLGIDYDFPGYQGSYSDVVAAKKLEINQSANQEETATPEVDTTGDDSRPTPSKSSKKKRKSKGDSAQAVVDDNIESDLVEGDKKPEVSTPKSKKAKEEEKKTTPTPKTKKQKGGAGDVEKDEVETKTKSPQTSPSKKRKNSKENEEEDELPSEPQTETKKKKKKNKKRRQSVP